MTPEFGLGSSHEYTVPQIHARQVEKLENEELQDIESLPESIREYVIRLWNITSKKSAIRKEIDQYYVDKNMFEREDGDGLDDHIVNEWKRYYGDLLQDEFVTYHKLYKVFRENPESVHNAFKEYIRRSM
ncbi:MAG: hypothetical protein KBC98_01625, partial [Candidatus Pacebacteria bacterium]|nr:hypothetical protein [Candidatus Paceibacterota bacterium]